MNGSSMKIHHRSWLDSEIRRIRCVKYWDLRSVASFRRIIWPTRQRYSHGRLDSFTRIEDNYEAFGY